MHIHNNYVHYITRSLDDTEVLRRKYAEAKQSYEEKVCYSCLRTLYQIMKKKLL